MKTFFVLLVLALAVMSSFRGKEQSAGCTGLCSLMIAQLEASSAAEEKSRLARDHATETTSMAGIAESPKPEPLRSR